MEEELETAGNEALPDFIVLNLEAIEACYGAPEVESLSYDLEEEDFELVLRSKRKNRTHDVTVYIIVGNRVAVIAKPSYPPGVYLALFHPSAGSASIQQFDDKGYPGEELRLTMPFPLMHDWPGGSRICFKRWIATGKAGDLEAAKQALRRSRASLTPRG